MPRGLEETDSSRVHEDDGERRTIDEVKLKFLERRENGFLLAAAEYS